MKEEAPMLSPTQKLKLVVFLIKLKKPLEEDNLQKEAIKHCGCSTLTLHQIKAACQQAGVTYTDVALPKKQTVKKPTPTTLLDLRVENTERIVVELSSAFVDLSRKVQKTIDKLDNLEKLHLNQLNAAIGTEQKVGVIEKTILENTNVLRKLNQQITKALTAPITEETESPV